MKNEIMNLLTLGKEPKTISINGVFKLTADYADEFGVNAAISKHPAALLRLTLRARPINGIEYSQSAVITAREYHEVTKEISEKMAVMMSNINAEMLKRFANGTLEGRV